MRLIILLALVSAAYAELRQSNRIVGGESTTIENYPFMAGMLFSSWVGLTHFCGGTLVSETSVVSAAHCYMGGLSSTLRVRLGSNLAYSGGIVHTVSRMILHEEYNPNLSINDVAVIRLTNPAVFSNQIKIARIAGPQYILPDNTLVYTSGWGETKFQGSPSDILQHVAVYTINHQLCSERYKYLKTLPDMAHIPEVTPEMLCTGILDVGGKDACQGDSGGPVIHNGDVLVGIISWGHECAHKTYPGVNARVSSYTDWIYTNSVN